MSSQYVTANTSIDRADTGRDPNFPQATENPSLDPLMHEGPSGSNLAMDKAWTPGSNGAQSGSATRMRIPIERR